VKTDGASLARALSAGKLSPIYVLVGDDPLLVNETQGAIRAAARKAGFSETCRLDVESGFDWSELRAAAQARSLFSSKKLIDLRMKAPRPGREGGRELAAYAADPDSDCILMVSFREWETAAGKSAWLGKLEAVGTRVELRAVRPEHMPRWVQGRAQAAGLSLSQDALECLVHRSEGNLLAAHQSLEKLRLIHGPGEIGLEQVSHSMGDSARFDIFAMTDAMVAGKPGRVLRILESLQAENEPVVRALWAITRELRMLASVAGLSRHEADSLLAKSRLWPAKRAALIQAAKRRPAAEWNRLLVQCSRADAVAKGQEDGDAWLLARSLACDAAATGLCMSHVA